MKSVTLIALLAGATVTAHANEPVGVLKNVSGTISVSGQKFMTRASEGTPVANGSSVLVASNGKATLVLNNGCTIPLAASQHLVVDAKLPCQQIQASVKQLFPAYQVAQANVTAGLPVAGQSSSGGTSGQDNDRMGILAFGGLALLGLADASKNTKSPVSPQ